jgi:hypothetical protein
VRAFLAIAVGFGSGVASGAFGIGGALLSTPGIRVLLGTPALVAVGTTLPVIVPTAITGVYTYHRNGFVDVRRAAVTAAAGGVFAVAGAFTTKFVPGPALLIGTAAMIFAMSMRMLPKRKADAVPRFEPNVRVLVVVGALSGFVSGLLGVGGGVILVPVFTVLLRMPVKTALGTSLAVVAAQAIPGTAVHALLRHIDWPVAAGLSIGVVPGARLGANLAVAAQDDALRVVVGLGMAALALAFGANEFRALIG